MVDSDDSIACEDVVVPESPPSDDEYTFDVVRIGLPFEYVVPSFSVIAVTLRQIRIEGLDKHDQPVMYDAFIRDDQSIDRQLPFSISVTNWCQIPIEEFCKVVTIRHLKFPTCGALLIWEWSWLSDEHSSTPPSPVQQNEFTNNASEIDVDPSIQHTVCFKCIGVTKEQGYQQTLAEVAQIRRSESNVEVRLCREPSNPFDAKAIAFQCMISDTWKTVGYVVREVLDEVHLALENQQILHVKFNWVKFKMNWCNSGFGWFAGIDITKQGHWSNTVRHYASTNK